MKTQLATLMALFVGILSAQLEMNYSYEMKFGKGKEVRGQASSNPYTTDYSYIENLLDINTYFMDNIYAYTQLEYSNPPVYGYNKTGIDSVLNTFYLEYSHDRFNVKLGDLYELYGRGLGLYTLQDQNVDYDNSIRGLSFHYFLKENLSASTLIGTGEYAFRSNPANRTADYQFDTDVSLASIDYNNQLFGYFQTVYLAQKSFFTSDLITDICKTKYNEIGKELEIRPGSCFDLGGKSNTVNAQNINLSWSHYIGSIDIYIDKAWVYYNKIHGDGVFGSRFYASVYTELFGMGITYEYKNYFTPYLIKSLSNPPIVYREGSSILASRNAHSMNFGNETGHQIDFNRQINGALNILGNLSISKRHKVEGMGELSFIDVLIMEEDSSNYNYFPFRQLYLEINGWSLSDRLYHKVGLDYFTELNFIETGKNIFSVTIPTQWVYKLSSGSSITTYLEAQKKTEKQLDPNNFILSHEINYTNYYSSLSYSHFGKWIVTGFLDQEVKDGKSAKWIGADLSYKLSTETQISIFYGSQKGGLVCANGICAEQPGFEDGLKVTFRSLF